tara:strand:+ start:16903 stop:17409 length:507 start_codon:yes stop_codon:yes gene_type:complete
MGRFIVAAAIDDNKNQRFAQAHGKTLNLALQRPQGIPVDRACFRVRAIVGQIQLVQRGMLPPKASQFSSTQSVAALVECCGRQERTNWPSGVQPAACQPDRSKRILDRIFGLRRRIEQALRKFDETANFRSGKPAEGGPVAAYDLLDELAIRICAITCHTRLFARSAR